MKKQIYLLISSVFSMLMISNLGAVDGKWQGSSPNNQTDLRDPANWDSYEVPNNHTATFDGTTKYLPTLSKGSAMKLAGINFIGDDIININAVKGLFISEDIFVNISNSGTFRLERGFLSIHGFCGTGGGTINYCLNGQSFLDLSSSPGSGQNTMVNITLTGGNNSVELPSGVINNLNSDNKNDFLFLNNDLTLVNSAINKVKGTICDDFFYTAKGITIAGLNGSISLTNSNMYRGPTIVTNGSKITDIFIENNLGDPTFSTNTLILDNGTVCIGGDMRFLTREVQIETGGGTIDTGRFNLQLGDDKGDTGGLINPSYPFIKKGSGNLKITRLISTPFTPLSILGGKITIIGSFEMSNLLAIGMSNQTKPSGITHGKLIATGAVNIAETSYLTVLLSDDLSPKNNRYTIIHADGGINGKFNPNITVINASNGLPLSITPKLNYDHYNVYLDFN